MCPSSLTCTFRPVFFRGSVKCAINSLLNPVWLFYPNENKALTLAAISKFNEEV